MLPDGQKIHVGVDGTPWDNERGFGRFTRHLIGALARRESEFRCTLLFDRWPERPVPDGVEVKIAGHDESISDRLSSQDARGKSDLLSMSLANRKLDCDLFFFPAVYSYYPVLARRRLVACFHDTIPERFPDLIFPTKRDYYFWNAKCWLAKKQATRVMTISQASADDLSDILRIPTSRIDTITEGAGDAFKPVSDQQRWESIRSKYGIPKDAPLLAYVGGFNRHKNVIQLLRAMPEVLKRRPDVKLAIVGRTTGARFWDNVDDLQRETTASDDLRESVTFTGEIDDEDLNLLLNTSDALVFPSLWEGFGLPAVEAMSCGTPVLASNRGSLPEVVGDGGLYYDPESVDELIAAADRLLSSDELRSELSHRALKQASEFSWDKGAELAEDSFRKALA